MRCYKCIHLKFNNFDSRYFDKKCGVSRGCRKSIRNFSDLINENCGFNLTKSFQSTRFIRKRQLNLSDTAKNLDTNFLVLNIRTVNEIFGFPNRNLG